MQQNLNPLVESLLASGEAKYIPWDDRYVLTKNGECFSRAINQKYNRGRYKNSWKKLKPISPTKNYLYPRYTIGRGQCEGIHVLMMKTFIGQYPDGMQIRHLDGNYCNYILKNLSYGTPKENMADAKLHGTAIKGERCWNSKINENDVRMIRSMSSHGYRNIHIAEKFKCHHKFISGIVKRASWNWVID